MKKTFLLLAIFFYAFLGHAQQITRLTQKEIKANETPQAAAYNFVTSAIKEDYAQTVELMSLDFFFNTVMLGGISPQQMFSEENTHTIVDMRPMVKMGYEVVVTDIQSLDSEQYFDENSKYRNEPAFSISLNCADTNDKFYDGSKGHYDTDVKVLMVKEDGQWKVYRFE